MKKNLTRAQYDEICNCYEEARSREHNSTGGWHSFLIAALKDAGIYVKSYQEALKKAREVIYG